MTGSKLIERIRIKTFACLLQQETAYFDQPENSSGAISLRLSSEAAAFEQMFGTRISVICETTALIFFGFIFGMLFSWQLTLIISLVFLIVIVTNCIDVYVSRILRNPSDVILQKANTVRSKNYSAIDVLVKLFVVRC